MSNNQNTLFSSKGFYLGVAIFILGLVLMIARVVVEVNSYTSNQSITTKTKNIDNNISENILKLQQKLDQKIEEQENMPKKDFSESVKQGELTVFDHNPIKNKKGIITVFEFIDFGCNTCLVDANFTHRLLKDNENIKFISKLNNTIDKKQLHVANIAALTAAKKGKYFEFREKMLTSTNSDLNKLITKLEDSGVTLRDFRKSLTDDSNSILNNLSEDISQAQKLKVKYYSIFINNRNFSDAEDSEYKLKDITVYLNNI